MSSIFAFVPVIFNLLIIACIIFGIKNRIMNKQGKAGVRKDPNVNSFNEMVNHYNTVNKRPSALRLQGSMTLRDDRSNDWMAKQLREEAQSMVRVSEMFQLKQAHMNNCDAEFIRRFHESGCDAHGIDDGSPRKRTNK